MTEIRRSVISGCEPYTMDFGDREFGVWLKTYLTADEYRRRSDFDGRLQKLDGRLRRWRLPARVRRIVTYVARRRVLQLNDLARERGGPPPGPSWKVRTEWGT